MVTQFAKPVNRAAKPINFYLRSVLRRPGTGRLNIFDRQVLANLRHEGVSLSSVAAFGSGHSFDLLAAAEQAASRLSPAATVSLAAPKSSPSSHRDRVKNEILLTYPDIYMWGLQARLVDLFEVYFQQPVAYLGVSLARDFANSRQTGVRYWHRDGEDFKVIKVKVYLNDVDAEGGPFEYIPRYIKPSHRQLSQYGSLLEDKHMAAMVDRSFWRQFTGTKGAIAIIDTASVFHHASVPQRERLALTYTYTSARPKNLPMARQFLPVTDGVAWHHLKTLMTPKQKRVALNWRYMGKDRAKSLT